MDVRIFFIQSALMEAYSHMGYIGSELDSYATNEVWLAPLDEENGTCVKTGVNFRVDNAEILWVTALRCPSEVVILGDQ